MPDDVTDAELAVLEALWADPGATIRRLTGRLYPEGRASQYATVQKLLDRLEAKGFVTRDRSAAVHAFHATVDRDGLIGRRLRDLADRLCDGSVAPLLSNLVAGRRLSKAERDALKDLVARLDRPKRGGG